MNALVTVSNLVVIILQRITASLLAPPKKITKGKSSILKLTLWLEWSSELPWTDSLIFLSFIMATARLF